MDERQRYLISFLMILVARNKGELIIENLSDFFGKQLYLSMNLDPDNDRVVLTTKEEGLT